MGGLTDNSYAQNEEIKPVENQALLIVLLIGSFVLVALRAIGMFLQLLPSTLFYCLQC